MRATFAKIYIKNLRHNLKVIREKINPSAKMCVAVKADAYGHGAVRCAKEAVSFGADFLAVATVDEGAELRAAGIKVPILILSLCQKEEMENLVKNDITPLVFDDEYIELIEEAAKKAGKTNYSVHLAVDTGMGRIGCLPKDAVHFAKKISSSKNLSLGGMCTHFAVADSNVEDDIEYTKKQFENFKFAFESVEQAGINPGIRHCANSALTLDHPEMHLDMCRPGIIVYGYYPDMLDRAYFEKKGNPVDLKPVMALVTKIVAKRHFSKGQSISYGRTWTCEDDTEIGVLPVGYGDGFFRCFSTANSGLKVSIDGKAFPIRGRICMDQCMVDLGKDSKIDRWSDVVIFGPAESGAVLSAQEFADATNTISYEVTCGITKRVPRVFIEE
ncbi:alanine racemase [Treponema zioleckii]|uniref:alanine racemase n=1 Tax=Treponema zioleckii TaxID=331680 RepID=UPI00168B9B9A|nr:alanine racemase [Treponema zioleckii]